MDFDGSKQAALLYWRMAKEPSFTDKTDLLEKLFGHIGTDKRYVCLSCSESEIPELSPMLISFLDDGCDMSDIFGSLRVAKSPSWLLHLHKHRVISIDMQKWLDCSNNNVKKWLGEIEQELGFSDPVDKPVTVNMRRWTEKTGERFVFILNHWDSVFQMPFMEGEKPKKEYMRFLDVLFWNQNFCEMALLIGNKPTTDYAIAPLLSMFTNLKWPDR